MRTLAREVWMVLLNTCVSIKKDMDQRQIWIIQRRIII